MEELSDIEIDVAKEIINIGLGKAADSMAFFTREKVFIRSLDLQVRELEDLDSLCLKEDQGELYVLTTTIEGELTGVCYLIFSEDEVHKLFQISLPESIRIDKEKTKVMGEAILLEMDNIITASVITQFANFFKLSMQGSVPTLTKTIASGLEQIVKSTNRTAKYYLYFKSEFNTGDLDINPEFVWLLDDKYLEGVKNFVKNEDNLKKLKELTVSVPEARDFS